MKYRGVIFDLDGVLCSTDEYHYLAWKEIGEAIGIDFTRADNHRLRGVSRMESLEILLEKSEQDFSQEKKELLAERKNRIYRKYLERMSEKDLVPGALELFSELKKRNLKIAVGSSSKNAGFILEKLGIRDAFDAVVDGNDIEHSKPHPEVFLNAAEALGLEPGSILVLEDAEAGIEAARAGGFVPVGIGPAAGSAVFRIDKLSDLLVIIK